MDRPAPHPKYKCRNCSHLGGASIDYKPPGAIRTGITMALCGNLLGIFLLNRAGKKAFQNAKPCCAKCQSHDLEEVKETG